MNARSREPHIFALERRALCFTEQTRRVGARIVRVMSSASWEAQTSATAWWAPGVDSFDSSSRMPLGPIQAMPVHMRLRDLAPDPRWARSSAIPQAAQEPPECFHDEREFAALRVAYRATGGVACGDDLARLLEDQRCGDFVSLARLIASRDIFGFVWQHAFWVPMFQFDLRDLTIKSGPRRVLAELAAEFDGWALADWFVRASSWLNGQRPVDLLDSDLPSVLKAARADRFIAAG
jgi:hypothetical protein